MAKIDDIYAAADDYGLVTTAEARALGVSDVFRQENLSKKSIGN